MPDVRRLDGLGVIRRRLALALSTLLVPLLGAPPRPQWGAQGGAWRPSLQSLLVLGRLRTAASRLATNGNKQNVRRRVDDTADVVTRRMTSAGRAADPGPSCRTGLGPGTVLGYRLHICELSSVILNIHANVTWRMTSYVGAQSDEILTSTSLADPASRRRVSCWFFSASLVPNQR